MAVLSKFALHDAEYDQSLKVSKTIISYPDRHLLFHLAEINIFLKAEVHVAQYELAKGTNMFDYAVSLFQQIYPERERELERGSSRCDETVSNSCLVICLLFFVEIVLKTTKCGFDDE